MRYPGPGMYLIVSIPDLSNLSYLIIATTVTKAMVIMNTCRLYSCSFFDHNPF